jgi:predicted nucleic acid-binding protein
LSLVLDGSMAIAWCFQDERSPAVDAVHVRVGRDGAVVPSIWSLEVANVLLMGVRRGKLTLAERDMAVSALLDLAITTESDTSQHVWSRITRLAEQHRLTTYDASYLELAHRRRLPLATLDAALARAAIAEGVTVLP